MRLQIPFSVLDLSNVRLGETPREALQQTVDLARHVEALGFKRFWLAEHHGVLNSASAATSVVIGHVAGKTSVIRVGSGGVMLPNHPPLMIAEQFGTLASLYPDRIDLGLGRAAGGHDGVLQALRVGPDARDRFPSDVRELQFFFREPTPDQQSSGGAGSRHERADLVARLLNFFSGTSRSTWTAICASQRISARMRWGPRSRSTGRASRRPRCWPDRM